MDAKGFAAAAAAMVAAAALLERGAHLSLPVTGFIAFAVGSVHTIQLSGVNAHPFHLHVNHFQLQADPADTHGSYFLAGDWHDVLFMPTNNINVKFQADKFTGPAVIQCVTRS